MDVYFFIVDHVKATVRLSKNWMMTPKYIKTKLRFSKSHKAHTYPEMK